MQPIQLTTMCKGPVTLMTDAQEVAIAFVQAVAGSITWEHFMEVVASHFAAHPMAAQIAENMIELATRCAGAAI